MAELHRKSPAASGLVRWLCDFVGILLMAAAVGILTVLAGAIH